MKNTLNYAIPFFLGVGLTIASITLLGAAAPQEAKSDRDTQIVPIAGGLAMILAVNDHKEDRLYIYELQRKKEGGKVELRGSIDLSATGQEQLPGKFDLD